jgi:hypothetical protein
MSFCWNVLETSEVLKKFVAWGKVWVWVCEVRLGWPIDVDSGAVRRAQELSSQSESSGQVSGCMKFASKSLKRSGSGSKEFSGQSSRSRSRSMSRSGKLVSV